MIFFGIQKHEVSSLLLLLSLVMWVVESIAVFVLPVSDGSWLEMSGSV